MPSSSTRKPTPLLSRSELRGLAQLATQGTLGVTDIVEGMHQSVWSTLGLPGGAQPGQSRGLTRLIYSGIRGTTRVLGGGIDQLLGAWPGSTEASTLASAERADSSQRQALLAVLNGVLGDHLAARHNPLATPMSMRGPGITAPGGSGKILLLIHGLCMNDLQWRSPAAAGHAAAPDHGQALAEALGYSPVYLRYNSGLHISENGAELARQLQALLDGWPEPVQQLAIIGHSMGGLVARSACQIAEQQGLAWRQRLKQLVFLGSPHHGAPLERAGNWIDVLLGSSRYSAPLARLGKLRSAGITDLRHGLVQHADWQGRDRFARGPDQRQPLPLPAGVACYTVAGSSAGARSPLSERLLGDGLVPLHSALGEHARPELDLHFPPEARRIVYRCGHLQLLSSTAVRQQLLSWLAPA